MYFLGKFLLLIKLYNYKWNSLNKKQAYHILYFFNKFCKIKSVSKRMCLEEKHMMLICGPRKLNGIYV